MTIETGRPPLEAGTIDELLALWQAVFALSFEESRGVLGGEERGFNRDWLYMRRADGALAGTAHLTVSVACPRLGGLGEVAVPPAFRGRGIASELCALARDAFAAAGGEALFLATSNPAAFRVYERLGWQPLANANVMTLLPAGGTPAAFLDAYFAQPSPVTVSEGTAGDRIAMIPLIVAPHDWRLLDVNTGLFSIRHVHQPSCMGLYPRYAHLREDGQGTWFSAHDSRGRLVGLASARLDGEQARVDGFTHPLYLDGWESLLQAAMAWSAARGATVFTAAVADADADKASRYRQLEFRPKTCAIGSETTEWVRSGVPA
jgi:GNAT superfamily N-acetyltransferase